MYSASSLSASFYGGEPGTMYHYQEQEEKKDQG